MSWMAEALCKYIWRLSKMCPNNAKVEIIIRSDSAVWPLIFLPLLLLYAIIKSSHTSSERKAQCAFSTLNVQLQPFCTERREDYSSLHDQDGIDDIGMTIVRSQSAQSQLLGHPVTSLVKYYHVLTQSPGLKSSTPRRLSRRGRTHLNPA